MKRLLISVIGFTVLLASGCGNSFQTTQSIPKEVMLEAVHCPPNAQSNQEATKAENFQVLSTQTWTERIVVLYSAVCPTNQDSPKSQHFFGHQVVRRSGKTWEVSGGDSYATKTMPTSPGQFVAYGISHSTGQSGDRYAILYGQVTSPRVSTIEATFDNGQHLQTAARDGVFALLAPNATGVCEIRILGVDGQILQKDDLNIPKGLIRGTRSGQCLPTTQQL